MGTNLNSLKANGASARASISNDGITATLTNSNGVASVNLNSAGTIQVNWTTAFSDTNYQVIPVVEGTLAIPLVITKTTGYAIIETRNTSNVLVDRNIALTASGN